MWAILRIWALLHGRYVSGSLGLGREAFTSHLIALEGVSSLETPRLDAPPKNPLYKGFIIGTSCVSLNPHGSTQNLWGI